MKKGSKFSKIKEDDRFGLLKVIKFSHYLNRMSYWFCKCDCGSEKIYKRKYIKESKNPHCGCVPQINNFNRRTSKEEAKEFKMNRIKNLSHWEADCWIWDGYMQRGTTPRVSTPNGGDNVRRWMCEYYIGKIPEKKFVVPLCENYRCININHMGFSTNGRINKKNESIRII